MGTVERLQQDRKAKKLSSSPVFVKMLLLLVALIAAFLLINSTYFTVGSVLVEGNKYVSVQEIYRAADIPEKVNIFRMNTADIRDRLQRDLRIANAEVSRKFPSSVVIRVTERQPVAFIANAFGYVQLDKDGVVLTVMKSVKEVSAPMITGIKLGNIYVGDKVETASVKNVLAYLSALDDNTLNQLSEINIKPSGELTVYTTQMITIRLGNGERLEEKAKLTRDVMRDIGDKKAAVDYIDLNFASPYIKFRQQQ